LTSTGEADMKTVFMLQGFVKSSLVKVNLMFLTPFIFEAFFRRVNMISWLKRRRTDDVVLPVPERPRHSMFSFELTTNSYSLLSLISNFGI
jgi:hypothetical protein